MTIKPYSRYLKILIVLALSFRFLIDFFGVWAPGFSLPRSLALPSQKNWTSNMIMDDREVGRAAYLYIRDHKFETEVSAERPKFREATIWPTAFRNTYNILYQVVTIRVYEFFHGPVQVEMADRDSGYFTFFIISTFFFKWILSLISLFYLYRCAGLFLNETGSWLFILVWVLYPSNFYVFQLNGYDTVSAPLVTIIVCRLILLTVQDRISYRQILILGLLCSLAFTIKFHVFVITSSICLFAVMYGIFRRNIKLAISFAAIFLLHFSVIFPLMSITKSNIGHAVLSTQAAMNLFHGHNPVARGSWVRTIWTKYPEVMDPILESVKDKLAGDEYTETQAYKKLAIDWAMSHPKEELVLSLRKVAIYFAPNNFMNWTFNPILFLVHLGFILFSLFVIINPSRFGIGYWFLIVPAWAVVALNVLYFAEYRWRYYVEPEMLLCFIIGAGMLYEKIRGRDVGLLRKGVGPLSNPQ